MAAHSSILAWRLPWTEEPGGLLSMGSQRVGHDWSDFTHAQIHYTVWCSIDGHLNYLQFWVQWTFLCKFYGNHVFIFFLNKHPEVKLLGHRYKVFSLIRNFRAFLRVFVPFYTPTGNAWEFHSCSTILLISLFNFSHSAGWVVVSLHGFNLHLLWLMMLSASLIAHYLFVSFFVKCLLKSLA